MGFPAKHEGECGECDNGIRVGQMITYRGLDEGVMHVTCPPAPAICARCFLQQPCGCDDS